MESSEQLKELSRRRNSHYRTTSKWLKDEKDTLDLFIFAYSNPSGYIHQIGGNRNAIYAFLSRLISELAKDENRSFNDVIASIVVGYHNATTENEDK